MAKSKGLKHLAKAQELYAMYHLSGINEFDAEILHSLNLAIGLGISIDQEVMAHYIAGHIYLDEEHLSEAEVKFAKVIELNKHSKEKMDPYFLGRTWEHLLLIAKFMLDIRLHERMSG